MSVNTLHLSEPAGAGQLAGEGEVGEVAALRAGLKDAAGAADRVAEEEALSDVLRAGLLAVDVLAGLCGVDARGGVPVGAGGNEDGVDVAAVEELAEVLVHRAGIIAVLLVGHLLDADAPVFLDVADRRELDVVLLEKAAEVVSAAVADADAAEDDALARRDRAVEAEGGAGDHGGGDRGGRQREAGLEEAAARGAGAGDGPGHTDDSW